MCDAEVLCYRGLPKLSEDGTECFHIQLHEMRTAFTAFGITEMLQQKCVTVPNTTLLEDGQTRLQVPSVHFLWYWLRYNNDGAAVSIKSNTNQFFFLHSYSFSEQFKDCLKPWHCSMVRSCLWNILLLLISWKQWLIKSQYYLHQLCSLKDDSLLAQFYEAHSPSVLISPNDSAVCEGWLMALWYFCNSVITAIIV